MGRSPRTRDEFSQRVIEELFAAMPQGISIREIGRRAGVNHSQLSRIKNGERVLDVDQLEVLARVAGVAPHVIVERAERTASNVVEFPAAPQPPTAEDAAEGAQAAYRPKIQHQSMEDGGDHLED